MEQTWNERGTNMEQRGTNVKRTWNKRGTNVEVLIYLIKNKSCRKQIIRKYLIKLNRYGRRDPAASLQQSQEQRRELGNSMLHSLKIDSFDSDRYI